LRRLSLYQTPDIARLFFYDVLAFDTPSVLERSASGDTIDGFFELLRDIRALEPRDVGGLPVIAMTVFTSITYPDHMIGAG
jgi:hypothetical protein